MSDQLTCPNGHRVAADETTCPACQTLLSGDALPAPSESRLPQVPGYEILGELGRGGMGVVYKARHLALGRLIALKMVLAGPYASPEGLMRLRREAEAAARLQHPHIVQIHEIGQHDGRWFLALEYLDGGTLQAKLAGRPQAPRAAAETVRILAGAAHAAHEKHVVHRDLKPANVLLTADGIPKIADFGLAKQLDGPADLTAPDAALGTPSYMAPEQVPGGRAPVGPAADVWALGALLYQMLTGRPPFLGETVADTLVQVARDEPVPPRRLLPKVPRDLETICLKCLMKDPARRYASARDLADDLGRFLDGRPVVARPIGRAARAWAGCRRNPAVASLAAGLVVVALTGLGAVLWKWREAEAESARAWAAERRAEGLARETLAALDELAGSYRLLVLPPADGGKERPLPQRLRAAAPSLTKAAARLERLAAEYPTATLRGHLADLHATLAVLHGLDGKRSEAVVAARRALVVLEELDREGEAALGDRFFVTGAALMNFGEHGPAERAFGLAVAHRRRDLDAAPDSATARKALSAAHFHRGHVLRELGRLDEAANEAATRRRLWPKHPDEVYDVACELARCAALVGKGKASPSAEELAARERYAAAAVAALRDAVRLGLTDPLDMDRDRDLALLRARADYQQLLTEVRSRSPK